MNPSEKNIPVHHLTSEQFQLMTLETGHPENFNDVHRHNFFEIIWFRHVKENSSLELDFEHHALKNNQICIIAPGQVFNMKLKGEKGYVMAISREIFKEACDIETILTVGSCPFSLDPQSAETCNTIISLMEEEYTGASRIDLLKAYLKAFCIIITEQIGRQDPSINDRQRIQKLVSLIEEHYVVQRDTRFYADQIKVSTHHLNDIVRLSRGTTVKKMIAQRLILEAKRELSFGALTVKEIAFKLGFSDASYFSRFFKKHTGRNPEGFKEGKT
ncbi:helix-turn-helix domain-containing protein [Chryseobacterium carnipullorum]|uniref:helix-turn-helix domain-containing protein n=1 Tax=Chryseobacterium carnipullorum TaxID=1124835 RepID=UPI000E7E8E7B|nr:helix-turn-helix domain-containing protein [Chryseobacterium carnipullorum]HBV17315.1 AraC family transcriptional regulator [Chryseobacterium carnipullorum]